MATFTSKVNGNDIYAKRAEATRSGVNLETFTTGSGEGAVTTQGILPAGITTPSSASDDVNILATRKYVQDQVGEVAEAMLYKGAVDGTTKVLPTTGYKAGWTYKVAVAGTYAGQECEVGDLIIANKDFAGTASNTDWDVIQTNIDGAVVGPASAADTHLAAFDGTSCNLIADSGVAVTNAVSGSSTDAQVPTAAAVNTAITGAVNALDAEVTSDDGTNVQVTVTEVDGVVTAVNIATDDTINATDLSNAINDLDVSDLVQDTEGDKAGKTLKTLSETDGKITATFQDIKITSDKVTDRQTSTFDGTADTLTTGTAVKAAIDALDVSNISGFGAGKTLATLTETDGKIAATFQDIEIVSAKVTDKQTTTFDGTAETLTTGKAVKAAIDALNATESDSDNGVSVTVTETDGKITGVSVTAAQATAGSSTPGLVTYETVDL